MAKRKLSVPGWTVVADALAEANRKRAARITLAANTEITERNRLRLNKHAALHFHV